MSTSQFRYIDAIKRRVVSNIPPILASTYEIPFTLQVIHDTMLSNYKGFSDTIQRKYNKKSSLYKLEREKVQLQTPCFLFQNF